MHLADTGGEPDGGRAGQGREAGGRPEGTAAAGEGALQPRPLVAASLRDAVAIVKSTPRHRAKREAMGWFGIEEFIALAEDPRVMI